MGAALPPIGAKQARRTDKAQQALVLQHQQHAHHRRSASEPPRNLKLGGSAPALPVLSRLGSTLPSRRGSAEDGGGKMVMYGGEMRSLGAMI